MKALYSPKENSQAELKVTVDGEEWKKACKKAFKKIAEKVEIKGFRAGKAPAELVRKQVRNEEIWLQAVDDVAQEALNFGLDENPEIRLVDRPSLDVENINDDEADILFLLTVYPEVTLGDYKAIEYIEDKVSVLKKDVDHEIEHMREHMAEEVLKEEGALENGEIAVIDFEGFKDGVPFEGGKGTEYPLEIGSNTFIPGFEEQLIGMETEEEKDIEVTFPENYGVAELAGQPVVFHVKLDGIKKKVLPELNDEFVEELAINENVKTVDELTKYVKEQLTAQRKGEAEEKATNQLLDDLCEAAEVEIPQVMIDDEIEQTFQSYTDRIQSQGITLDMYYRIMGTDEAGFKQQIAPEAEKKVRIRLILEAIANDMGIEITDADIEEEFAHMAEQYEMDVDTIKELVPASYLKDDLKMQKALEELKKHTPKKSSKKEAKSE